MSVHNCRAGWWGVAVLGVSTQLQGWLVGCGSTRCQYTAAGRVGGVWQVPRNTAAGLVGGVWQVSVHSHRAS